MAKDSKNFKDRIKKATPNNQWFINVGKSLGFASIDTIKSLLPETSDTIDWNDNIVPASIDLIKNIRNNNGVRNMFNKQLENLPQVKAAKQLRDNAIADLKSGRIYNKNRELGLNDDGEFDFGDFDFGDDGDFSFVDDELTSDESSDNTPQRTPVTVINTMPLAKTMANAAEANINAMSSIAEQNMAIESEKIMLNKQSLDATLNALSGINDNLALLVQFNSDSTAKYQEAALKYFEESLNHFKKDEDDPKDDIRKRMTDMLNPFTSSGGIKLDEYGKIIKENLTKIKDESAELSTIFDFFASPDIIEGFAKNPLGMLMSWGMSSLIPKNWKASLKDLDKNLNGVLPAMLARINSYEGNDDPFLSMLNKVFGYKYKAAKDIDLGDYNKGAINWDGESKKALVEVIPSYLRRIESVLTGTEERIFNYSTGKFTDIDSINKYYNDRLKDAKTSGFSGVRAETRNVTSQLDLRTKDREQLEKDLNAYFEFITEKGYAINPFKKKDDFGLDEFTSEMSDKYDYDSNRLELVRRVLMQLPKSTLKEMATTAITDSRERQFKFMEDVRANPNLSGYAYLHNDLDKDGKMRYNKKFIGDAKKDRFGLSDLDYLRDIRSALINGIKVFPDHRKRYNNGSVVPNQGLLAKEKTEQEEYDKRERAKKEQAEQEDQINIGSGRSTYEAVNLTPEEWNKIYKKKKDPNADQVTNFIDKANQKIEDVEFELLFGDIQYRELAAEKLADYYKKGKSVMGSVKGLFEDTVKAFKSYFTGQDYITSDGILVKGEEHFSVMGSFKNFFTGIREKFNTTDVEKGGFFKRITDDFMKGFHQFKVSLFGEKALSEKDNKETFDSLMAKIKERLPKAFARGYGGALVGTAVGSSLGVLGSFIMPGGPLVSILTGTAMGLLTQSETFNRYMFGEKDDDGNRMGGLISKAWQDKFKESKGLIGKSLGVGLLGSFLLPGGPITGALLGIGTSIASRNEAFQEFLYGKDYKSQDKKSLMNGVFGKTLKNLGAGENPQLATFLAGTGLAVGVAQGLGFLPSFLLPGGPIMGAMLGLAGGIAASSDKFQEFLLGEKDVDGQRFGGLLHRVTNWLDIKFMQPLKIKATEITDGVYGFLRKKLFDPIARSFEPIVHATKNVILDIKDKIVDSFTAVTHPIVEAFKDLVIRPLGKVLKTLVVNPLKKILGTTFKMIGKTLLSVATLPLAGINMLGKAADKYNTKSELRRERRRRGREYDKNTDPKEWSRHGRKAAQKMSKEEEKQFLDEKLKYRDGKSWRQRKKEQKGEYKDDMARRKERLDNMKQQYEEDKKIAKESKFKFGGKKQKEKREQELKEKNSWYQQQQLLQAQDTDEKVSKIADNVIEFPKQTDRVVDKLGEVKDSIIDGFNKLMGKPSEPKSEESEKPSNVIPFYQGGDYGKVTDEDLDKLHDAGKAPEQQPTLKGQLKDAWDGFFGEVKELKQTIKDVKATKKESELIDTDKVTDLDLKEKFIKINKKYENRLKGNGKVIDINKKLQDEDHSHKDGLDLVPNDGYIAELHKGEMVVPEKPAGKLRGMMDKVGKGFSGLADALDETSKDDIDHREEESGVVEKSLIKGALGFGNMLASAMGNAGNMFGKLARNDVKDREDNALQLSDMEADRLKEIEDKARYDHVSRKGVDYIQEQNEKKDKEKAEKVWKDKLLSAVHGVGSSMRDAGMNIFDLLGKGFNWLMNGGLSSLLAALGLGALMKTGDDYQKSEEYIEGHTDADGSLVTDNYDLVKYRTMWGARNIFKKPLMKLGEKITKSKLYNSKFGKKFLQPVGNKISSGITKFDNGVSSVVKTGKEFLFGRPAQAVDNVVDLAAYKAAKTGAGAADNVVDLAAYKAAKNGAKIADVADTKLIKEVAENGATKKLSKLINNVADEGGLVHKLVQMGKVALEKIGEYATTKFPKLKGLGKKLVGCSDEIFGILLKNSDNILVKFGKKIGALVGKVAAGASTAFILDAVFAVGDLATGFTAGNAGNLFGVSPENVDARMRIISSIMQAVFNFNIIGVISLINEITNMMFNFNFLRNIAIWLYNITGGKQDFSSRITPEQIDSCTSIEQALEIMGITDPNEIMMLRNGSDWKDFSSVKNEELGGVISAAEQIELARLQYNLANGTKLNSQAFIDKTSKTFGTKLIDATKRLFGAEMAQTKYNRLTAKADTKQAKANEYAEKAKNSKSIIGKAWNSGMAWLNQKSADKASKKAEKTKVKAAKKLTKAQSKLTYHQAKAENSTGIAKWYHNWRANANSKKVKKYTIAGNTVQAVDESGNIIDTTSQDQVPVMDAEFVKLNYPDLAEGEIIEDAYGNQYNHKGELVYSPNWDLAGDAGMGEGDGLAFTQAETAITKVDSKAKKSSLLSRVGKTIVNTIPGGKAIQSGVKLLASVFGKNEKPEDYTTVPVLKDGKVVSHELQHVDDLTRAENINVENIQKEEKKNEKNKEVVVERDEKGNVVSYTTVDKRKKSSLFGKISTAVGSLFGLNSSSNSNSNSNSVDNSVTNNTGDEYITNNTTEVDTTPFGPLTDAINSLVESGGNNNIDEEGNIKDGGILAAITDPIGYLTKKLTNYGIKVYEDVTGEEVDKEKINKGVTIFNMLRNPFGYLASVIDGRRDTDNDGTKDISFIDASKDWAGEKWNNVTDWAGEAWDNTKNWFNEKSQPIIEWGKHQYNKTDDVADIMMGNNKARPNILSTGISVGSDIATKVWNSLASEDMQLAETDIADFTATFINKAFVKPFQELANPASEKFNEAKEAVSNWIGERKSNIYTWYTEEFKPGLEKSKEGAKKTQQALLDDVNKAKDAVVGWFGERKESFYDWYTEEFKPGLEKSSEAAKKTQQAIIDDVKERKDTIMNWYSDNIGKPLEKSRESAKKTQQAILTDVTRTKDNIMNWFSEHIGKPIKNGFEKVKKAVSTFVTNLKDSIVEAFDKYIKEPVSKAIKPVTDAVSGAWSSFKSAFEPFAKIFDAIKSGGNIVDIIKSFGSEGRKNANADEDNFHGATSTKPLDQQVKPKNYIFNDNENRYDGRDAGKTVGGLKDKGNTHNFPYYAQADNRWGKDKIGSAKMEDSGCGPTATAMVMTHLTGQRITPDTMAKVGKEYLPGYTTYNYFPQVADKFNLNYTEANDATSIKAKLMKGQPVLLSGYDYNNSRMTPFTDKGHIVVATGIDGNNVQINDPRGPEYSGSYSLSNILKGLKRGIVLSSTKDTNKVGLPTSGTYDPSTIMNGQYTYNNDLPTDDNMENLGGDAGQIKLWEKVIGYATAFKEKLKYVYGSKAIDKNGMTTDCSGFTKHVMDRCGISIPAGSANQKNAGTNIDPSQAQAGDLIVWKGHAGLVYDSNKNMIDAGSGSVPKIRSYDTSYWKSRGSYVIRRVIDPNKLVSAKVDNYHTGIGFNGIVGSQGGQDLAGGTSSSTTDTTGTTTSSVDTMGVFGKMTGIANGLLASTFNGSDMFDAIMNPSAGNTPTSNVTTTTDISNISDTAEAVWKFFTGKGYSKHATAGIMGNLQQESTLDPNRYQSGGGKGRGIAQWTVGSDRFKGLEAHAKSKGKDWTDLQSQLEWIDLELGGKDPTTAKKLNSNYGGLDGFKKATDTKWAVEAFEKSFERAGKPMYEKRYKYADDYFAKFNSAGLGAGYGFNMATSAETPPSSGIPTTLNGWAYYSQNDPQWQEDINGKKIGPAGCGMTAHAMMLTTMFNKKVTPVTVGKWARANNYWNNGMSWEMPAAIAKKMGLQIVKSESNTGGLGNSALANIKSTIKSGYPVVMSGVGKSGNSNSPFTGSGHIVLGVGVDGSGNVIINDPRGTKYTKAYTDDGIMNIGTGLRGYWAFDKTSNASLPSDWMSGDYTSTGTTNTDGSGAAATSASSSVDPMGVFGKIQGIANGLLASVYNGKDMFDAVMNPSTGTDTTTTGGTTPTGDASYNGTKYDLSVYNMDGLSDKKQSHINKMIHGTLHTYKTHGLFPSVTLAQSVQESGWGLTSGLATKGNAAFGIKADKSWTGPVYSSKTKEYVNGKNITITDGFRAYNSIDESIIDRANFLKSNSRYTKAGVFSATTPEAQAKALKAAGYATDPNYASALTNLIKGSKLDRFDTPNPPKEASAGNGDGNTYLVSPKGDAGYGEGPTKASYSGRNVGTPNVKPDVNAKRQLDDINRKVNVAFNNINTADPNAYADILKMIMQELQAINSNTAATAKGVSNIEIVSANEPITNSGGDAGSKNITKSQKKNNSSLQKLNTSTGYNTARQIAGYK